MIGEVRERIRLARSLYVHATVPYTGNIDSEQRGGGRPRKDGKYRSMRQLQIGKVCPVPYVKTGDVEFARLCVEYVIKVEASR